MFYAIQWVRSLLFIVLMYVGMAVIAIVFLPWAILSQDGAIRTCHIYTNYVRWIARVVVGLRSEIRGTPPTGECLVAAKHQSFFDIILIFNGMPRPRFIMKSILRYAPFLGWYAIRIGCVPVNRGKRAQAIEQMKAGVKQGLSKPGQLIIYPQGTRVAPGVSASYKIGAGILYKELGQNCIPVATNVGVLWPRHGIYRKPGLAVVEFLPAIPAGKPMPEFMAELEAVVESNSKRLMAEAGYIE
jgi:1-acyl-sn-glycerol-3-phosphate acyltransferase